MIKMVFFTHQESQLDTDEGVSDWRVSEAVRSQLLTTSDNVFVDSFRHLHPERKEAFTCWNTKMNCRATNFGTRIDYILINKGLVPALTESDIRYENLQFVKSRAENEMEKIFKKHTTLILPGLGFILV